MTRPNFIEKHAAPWVGALLLVFLVFYSCSSDAANVTVNWQHDQTVCADNTSPPEDCPTTGFILSASTSETGTYTPVQTLTNGTLRTFTLTNVRAGRRCYFIVATSPGGNSGESNRACITVPFVPPKSPNVTVTIAIATGTAM